MKTENNTRCCSLLLMGLILGFSNSCNKDEESVIKDGDDNVYTSVTIGTQVWLVENLKTTKFNDGIQITNGTDNTAWSSLTTALYCWHNNDISNKSPYGALYNYSAVASGKLCPVGWHVPGNTELNTLVTFSGGEGLAGGKLKESGTAHWQAPNSGATDEYGFKALPGGRRESVVTGGSGGGFTSIGQAGWYWAMDESGPGTVLRYLFNLSTSLTLSPSTNDAAKTMGCAVRCMKD